MTNLASQFILAIESAVGGGSIALFADGVEIDQIVGPSSISRAEDLLPNIDALLAKNAIDKLSLSQIVVSAGPGSFTGIRIGLATALGLAAAFRIRIRRLSTLNAIALSATGSNDVIAALPVGRETICIQPFTGRTAQRTAISGPEAISNTEFLTLIEDDRSHTFIVNTSIYDMIPSGIRARAVDAGENLAAYLGRAAIHGEIADVDAPLFIGRRK